MDSIYSTGAKKTFMMMGINDITHSKDVDLVFDNYTKALRLLSVKGMNPHIQSTLLAGKSMEKYNVEVLRLNEKLMSYAKENNIPYINLNALLSIDGALADEYTTDGVHLNGKAYAVWGEAIAPYMSADL